MNWNKLEGKKVYVKTNSYKILTGVVEDITYMGKNMEDVDFWLISMTDKFGKHISFTTTDVQYIEEQE